MQALVSAPNDDRKMPETSSKTQACIFDLDGTLVDSLRDIAEAANECLQLLGLSVYSINGYRYLVGEGIVQLARRAIGESHPELVARLIELMRPRYRLNPLVHTRPYAGLPELVAEVGGAGMKLGVLSNKPHDMTQQITRAFWPTAFHCIQGFVSDESRKPNPQFLLNICRDFDLPPATVCLVGDTPTDVETARRAGCRCIAVTWGFRTRADLAAAGATEIVDTPAEVAAALGIAAS